MNRSLPLAAALTVLIGLSASAEDPRISVEVDAPFEPVNAVGLIVNGASTLQKVDTTISRTPANKILVSFPFRESEVKDGAAATAMVIAEDGMMAFGDMKLVETPEQRRALSEIPACPAEKIVTAGLEGQIGLLDSLLNVRTARRANSQRLLKEMLTPDVTAKLAKLEKGFGLAYTTPLSANLPPLELHDRAIRIIAALKDFRAAKARAEEKAAAEAAHESAPAPSEEGEAESAAPPAASDEAPAEIPADAAAGN